MGTRNEPCTALLHRAPDGELVVEIERTEPANDFPDVLESAVRSIVVSTNLQALCDDSARIFRKLTGYDRVMVYRFDEAGHGEVFSETKRPELAALLGNRYPASDIPQMARRLYERNRVRLLADVDYAPSALWPRHSPISGKELDMSLCYLRSVSPIHLQYLKNMGVAATLVVSLMVGGRLWGLISCHHYSPRVLRFESRSLCELLAEVIGTRIAALESFMRGQGELAARRLEQRMTEWISRDGDWRGALFDRTRPLLLPLAADGAALIFEDEVLTTGDVPGTDEIRDIARWVSPKLKQGLFSTASLGGEEPLFAPLAGVASGVVVVPISAQVDEMLIWFRNERVRTVTWGGNPFKSPSSDDDPSELSPRRSFAQWHQIVKGTSDPWTVADLSAARLIGSSVTDVVVQFRAVRILIAQDQLEQVLRQVRGSDQQVVVADARGLILESNAAFSEWLGIDDGALRSLDELPNFFADPDPVSRRLKALTSENKPWRGEAVVHTAKGRTTAVLVRADPVFVASGTCSWLRSVVHRSHRSEGRRGGAKALPRRHSSQQSKGVRFGRIAKGPGGSNTHVVGHRKRSTRSARNYRCDRYFRGSCIAGKCSEVGLAHRGSSGPACSSCKGCAARRRRTMTEVRLLRVFRQRRRALAITRCNRLPRTNECTLTRGSERRRPGRSRPPIIDDCWSASMAFIGHSKI